MMDGNKDLSQRREAAYGLIDLLGRGVLDSDANFVFEHGLKMIEGLYFFTIDHEKYNSDFTEKVGALFENLYLTAIFEDVAQEANFCLIRMKSRGIKLPKFFAYSPAEFRMHELTAYDKAIITRVGSKVSHDNHDNLSTTPIQTHIETIQALKTGSKGLSYPFFNDAVREYIFNYLSGLGIETRIVEYHHSYLNTQMRPIKNIVATIPGIKHPEKKILLTAHYDSIVSHFDTEGNFVDHQLDSISPGAEDNASGVAVLLEIARILKEEMIPLEYTVEIVFFDYEEWELNGSEAYVRHALINEDKIIGVLNFDMVGWDGGDGKLELITNEESQAFLNTGVVLISEVADKRNFVITVIRKSYELAGGGDYSSFWGVNKEGIYLQRGVYYAINVTAAWLRDEKTYPFYHSPEDTIDKLDFTFLGKVTQWAIEVVYGLANPFEP